jgi:hypothetical protein
MVILGANGTRKAIFLAEAESRDGAFHVVKAWPPIVLAYDRPSDIASVLGAVEPVLRALASAGRKMMAVLACASGRYSAANETIKAEGIVELIATQQGIEIIHVTPQRLKRALGCAPKIKWQEQAALLLNADRSIHHWAEGMAPWRRRIEWCNNDASRWSS